MGRLREVGAFAWSHVAAAWKWYIGILLGAYSLYKLCGPMGDWISAFLRQHSVVINGQVDFDGLSRSLLVSLCLLLPVLAVLVTRTLVALYQVKRAKAPLLAKTFKRTIEAADLIANRLFPGPDAIKRVLSCKQVYTLFSNGDCQFTELLTLCARDQNIHFMEKAIMAEPEAKGVEFPDEIALKVASKTQDKSVAYLISRNELRHKRVVIFFLPFIHTSNDERVIETTYCWNGLMDKLLTDGEEGVENAVKSVEPVPLVEYQFWVQSSLGELACEHIGAKIGTETIEKQGHNEHGMNGWIYRATNVPREHITKLKLTLRKN